MAPKRLKLAHATAPEGLSPARIALIETINKDCKMLELPVELLMEIFSWFSNEIPPQTSGYHNKANMDRRRTDQEVAMCSLSRTSAIWRHLLLARRWNEVKSQEMLSILKASQHIKPGIFSESLHFAHHVRTLRICLPNDTATNVLLVAAIKAMKNLHTFHVVSPERYDVFTGSEYKYTTPFDMQTFPQVRTICLPLRALEILKCFPKVTKVVAESWADDIRPFNVLGKHCKEIEELAGFQATEVTVRRLLRLLPNLRSLRIDPWRPLSLDILRSLSSLKQLSNIGFRTHYPDFEKVKADPHLLEVIKVSKELLIGSSSTAPKTITFDHERWDYTQARDIRWVETIVVGHEHQ